MNKPVAMAILGIGTLVGGYAVGSAAFSKEEWKPPHVPATPGKKAVDEIVAVAVTIGCVAYFITQLPELMVQAEDFVLDSSR